jgi:hypothetical protein
MALWDADASSRKHWMLMQQMWIWLHLVPVIFQEDFASFVKVVNFTHFSEKVQRLVTLHGASQEWQAAECSFALFETART